MTTEQWLDVCRRVDQLEAELAEVKAELAEGKRALAAYDKIRIERETYIISLIPKQAG